MKRITIILLMFINAGILYSQEASNSIAKIEREKYSALFNKQTINYPGDQTIDIKYYSLTLKIFLQPNNLDAKTIIHIKPVNNINSFFLDFTAGLTIDSVRLNDLPIIYSFSNNKLLITLDRTYNQGELLILSVKYHGVPPISGYGSFIFGNHSGTPSIYTLSEPYGAKDWFPCKDTPSDKADSSFVSVTCREDLYAVSNGKLISIENNGNGTRTFNWKNSYPIAQYLISIAVTNYTIHNTWFRYTEVDSMPVINYVYPEMYPQVVDVLNKTPGFLKVYSDAFGLYPFIKEKYGQAQFGIGGGMEHQTVASLGSFDEGLLVHELAHQWFGDKITCRDWHHIWLNEGFATWSSAYYYGQTYGENSYKTFISNSMSSAKNALGTIYVQDTNSIGEIFNGDRSYNKGAVVLHMLKGITGDSLFLKILKAYLSNPTLAFGTAVTEDFKAIAESVYGGDLSYFFNEWIYGEGYPKYSLSWNYTLESGNNYRISVNFLQAGNSNPSFFTMPLQLLISTIYGDTLITLFNNNQNQQFNFIIKGRPQDLIFDPKNNILKEVNIDSIPYDLMHKNYELYQNYPNPFNPSTRIRFRVPRRSFVTIKIYDFLGKLVAQLLNETKDYGDYYIDFTANKNITSGIYFCTMKAGDVIITKKMMILK